MPLRLIGKLNLAPVQRFLRHASSGRRLRWMRFFEGFAANRSLIIKFLFFLVLDETAALDTPPGVERDLLVQTALEGDTAANIDRWQSSPDPKRGK
jgi:hypothetical protein